jgi:hypothetical protein
MRARRYIAPILRVSGLVAVLALVLLYIDYRVAKASVMERLLGIGQRMAPYLDNARAVEAPREVHLNGLKMWVAAGKTDHSPAMVRKWYAERYAGKGTATDVITEQLKAAKMLPPSVSGLTQASFGDDKIGGMAALDLGTGLNMKALRPMMHKLASGKIGEVGHLRYLYFEKLPNGGTRFLTIWTDDTFDLTKFLPSGQEDAPGRDITDVPRYPGTIRVLAADERSRPGQMAVYTGSGSPELAAAFYDARMRTLGWQADPHFTTAAKDQGLRSRRYMNAKGHEVVLDLTDEHDGQGVTVSVIQLR